MDEQLIDLREIGKTLWQDKKIIMAMAVVFVVGAGAYLMVTPPTYQSTSLLRIKIQQGLADSILNNPAGNSSQVQQHMETDAAILKSRSVVESTIKTVAKPNAEGKYPGYESFVGRITTTPVKGTEMLQVNVTGGSPENAQQANKALIQSFLRRLAEMSKVEQTATRKFLENRVDSAKQELDTAEGRLQAYQIDNKIYSTSDQISGLTTKLTQIDTIKAENQLDLETAKAALASINGQLSSAGASIADSPAIQQYKQQLVTLESTKAGYMGKYTDEHPKMQEINEQIQQAQQGLNREISNVVNQKSPSSNGIQNSLLADKFKSEAAIAVAEGKANALAGLESQSNAEIAALPEKERGYIRVKRDADVAQEIYIMLAKRLEESKVAEVMVPNEVQIIDDATLPTAPIKPNKTTTMGIAVVAGLLAGMGLSVMKSLFNRKVNTASDAEQQLGLPVLGIIPDADTLKAKPYKRGSTLQSLRRKIWNK